MRPTYLSIVAAGEVGQVLATFGADLMVLLNSWRSEWTEAVLIAVVGLLRPQEVVD